MSLPAMETLPKKGNVIVDSQGKLKKNKEAKQHEGMSDVRCPLKMTHDPEVSTTNISLEINN